MSADTSGSRPEPARGHRVIGWLTALIAVVATFAGMGVLAAAHSSSEPVAIIFVNPHPDDEYQHWAVLENRSEIVSIVVLLTRGEQTAFCDEDGLDAGWQRDLEPAPQPLPEGRFSEACAEARVNAFTAFFTDMAAVDETVPGRFAPVVTSAPLDDPEGVVCRLDEADDCIVSTTVDVYRDLDGRGSLVVFDLGDADLTDAEVAWALRAVLDELADELVPDGVRVAGIIGSYSTPASGFVSCFSYPHPDHLAVDRVLYSIDFGAGFQASSTCATDPRRQLYARVSNSATDAAFATEPVPGSTEVRRTGAHAANYGWLNSSYYPVSRFGQRELFHQDQHYWVRFW